MSDDDDTLGLKVGIDIADFNARTGELKAGLGDVAKKATDVGVKAQAGSDKAADAFEHFSASVSSAKAVLASFAALVGVSFTTSAFENWVKTNTDAADKLVDAAAKTNLSFHEMQTLSGVSQLMGGSADGLTSGIETMQAELLKGKDASATFTAGLKALGISATQLKGQLPSTQIEIVAQAMSRFSDGASKADAAAAVLGDSIKDLIPYFDKGAKGIQELEQAVARSTGYLDDQSILGMAATAAHIRELSAAWKVSVYSVINPAVDAAVVKMTQLVESVTADQIKSGVTEIGDVVIEIIEKIAEFAMMAKRQIDELLSEVEGAASKVQGFFTPLEQAAGVLDRLSHGDFAGIEAQLSRVAEHLGVISSDTLKTHLADIGKAGVEAFGGLDAAAARMSINMLNLRQATDAAGASFDQLVGGRTSAHSDAAMGGSAYYGPSANRAGSPNGPQVPAMDTGKDDKDKAQKIDHDATASYELDVEAFKASASTKEEILNEQLATHQLTMTQWLAQTTDALEDEKQDIRAAYAQELADARITADQKAELRVRETQQIDEILKKELQAERKAAEDASKAWDDVAKSINSAFTGQIDSLLSGQETWHKAFTNSIKDISEQLLKLGVTKVMEGGENVVKGALGVGKVAGDAAGSAGLITSNTTLMGSINALTIAMGGTIPATVANTTATVAHTGVTAGNIGALLANTISTDANTLATNFAATVAGIKGILGFASGTPYVQNTGIAVIHRGEAIIPAHMNPGNPGNSLGSLSSPSSFGGALGAGGGGDTHNHHYNTNFHVSAMDSQSVKDMLHEHGATIAKSLHKAIRSGAHGGLASIGR